MHQGLERGLRRQQNTAGGNTHLDEFLLRILFVVLVTIRMPLQRLHGMRLSNSGSAQLPAHQLLVCVFYGFF